MKYILKYSKANNENNFVAIDNTSGGYPYRTSWNNAHVWTNLDDVIRFQRMFKSELLCLYAVTEYDLRITFQHLDTINHNICPHCGSFLDNNQGAKS
jgi:hypothetical protein